jgi:hypothetical protein
VTTPAKPRRGRPPSVLYPGTFKMATHQVKRKLGRYGAWV